MDNAEARRWFERASELDPAYARAYAGLGNTYIVEYMSGWNNLDPVSLDRAEEFSRRALALDSFNSQAHLIVGIVNFYRDSTREAIAAVETAIELNPNFEVSHAALGMMLARDGQITQAAEAIRRALRLNPLAPSTVLMSVAYVNFAAGRRQEAETLLERVRRAIPDNLPVRVSLAAAYEYGGRHEEARIAAQEILRVNPDFTAEIGTHMFPGLEQIFQPEDAAHFGDNLRKAGLP
jgi:adenylate cyclase